MFSYLPDNFAAVVKSWFVFVLIPFSFFLLIFSVFRSDINAFQAADLFFSSSGMLLWCGWVFVLFSVPCPVSASLGLLPAGVGGGRFMGVSFLMIAVSPAGMPSSSPVYQPTTVTYERHKEWSNNYLTDTVLPNCRQKPFLQRLLLISSVLLVILGLGLAVFALVSEINTHHEDSGELPDSLKPVDEDKETHSSEENSETEIPPASGGDGSHDHETNVVVGCVGICLVLLGFGLYIAFLHVKGACVGLIPSRSGHRSVPIQPESAAGADAGDTGITYKGVQVITFFPTMIHRQMLTFAFFLSQRNLRA